MDFERFFPLIGRSRKTRHFPKYNISNRNCLRDFSNGLIFDFEAVDIFLALQDEGTPIRNFSTPIFGNFKTIPFFSFPLLSIVPRKEEELELSLQLEDDHTEDNRSTVYHETSVC